MAPPHKLMRLSQAHTSARHHQAAAPSPPRLCRACSLAQERSGCSVGRTVHSSTLPAAAATAAPVQAALEPAIKRVNPMSDRFEVSREGQLQPACSQDTH